MELSEELEACLPSPDQTEKALADGEFVRELNGFLRTLSAHHRNIFLKRYWFARTLPEIARETGVSESAVKSSLFHTRQKLKSYLERKGGRV